MNNNVTDKDQLSEDLVFEDAQSDTGEEETTFPSTFNQNQNNFNPVPNGTSSWSNTHAFKSPPQEKEAISKQNDIKSSKEQSSQKFENNIIQSKLPFENIHTTSNVNGARGNTHFKETASLQNSADLHYARWSSNELKSVDPKEKDYYLNRLHDTFRSPTTSSSSVITKALDDQLKQKSEFGNPTFASPNYNIQKDYNDGYSSAKHYTPDPKVQRHIETLKREFVGNSRIPQSFDHYKVNGTSSYTQPTNSQYANSIRSIGEYPSIPGRTDFLSTEARNILNNSRSGIWGSTSFNTNPLTNYVPSILKESDVNQSFNSGLETRSVTSQPLSVLSQSLTANNPLKKSIIDPALEARVQKITEDILRRSSAPNTFKDNKYLSSSPIVSRYDPTKNYLLSPIITSQIEAPSGIKTPEKHVSQHEDKTKLSSRANTTVTAQPQHLSELFESTAKNLLKNDSFEPFHTREHYKSQINLASDPKTTRAYSAKDPLATQTIPATKAPKRGFGSKLRGLCARKKAQKPAVQVEVKKIPKKPLSKRYRPQLMCLLALLLYYLFIIYVNP